MVQGKHPIVIQDWRDCLGYPAYDVIKATLENTTNLIQTLQTKTREYMRDNYRTRVWALRPRHIDNVLYSDTFFSYVCAIRGYKYFQMFAFKHSKFERIHLMWREANAPKAYEDNTRSVGSPNKTVMDNASVLTGLKWTSVNYIYCIESGLTVPSISIRIILKVFEVILNFKF